MVFVRLDQLKRQENAILNKKKKKTYQNLQNEQKQIVSLFFDFNFVLFAINQFLLVSDPLDLRIWLGSQLALDSNCSLGLVLDYSGPFEYRWRNLVSFGYTGLVTLKLK
jgi:hypothetical protein